MFQEHIQWRDYGVQMFINSFYSDISPSSYKLSLTEVEAAAVANI